MGVGFMTLWRFYFCTDSSEFRVHAEISLLLLLFCILQGRSIGAWVFVIPFLFCTDRLESRVHAPI